MSGVIDRPNFAEGQILAAADLQSSQDHASGQMARHERGLHLWGIASGLALTKQPESTADTPPVNYVQVTLTAGMAIDGTGREIIVPAVGDGPGSGAWRVLVGFVQWNGTLKKFADAGDTDQGIRPRYAGVAADTI